jgi:hypothetical protein
MGMAQKRVSDFRDEVIPHLEVVRRVPARYQRLLPLSTMKRHQCAVIGGAPGALTLAISDRRNAWILEALSWLTGCMIFVVQVNASKMNLLIQRVERAERYRYCRMKPLSPYHPLRVHSMTMYCIPIPPLRDRD